METILISYKKPTNDFFTGAGIEKKKVLISHSQRKNTSRKKTWVEDKKEQVFNLCTSFEKRDTRKQKRKERNLLKRQGL
jgi:hypothetical protein